MRLVSRLGRISAGLTQEAQLHLSHPEMNKISHWPQVPYCLLGNRRRHKYDSCPYMRSSRRGIKCSESLRQRGRNCLQTGKLPRIIFSGVSFFT